MVDVVDKATRSRMMAGIRGKNTKPERIVRSFLHRAGLRFRIHAGLIGHPDIVLPRYRTVVFVHGCFWHRHPGCRYATTPATREGFWTEKFEANVARDKRVQRELRKDGWHVLVVWGCEVSGFSGDRRLNSLVARIRSAHGSNAASPRNVKARMSPRNASRGR